MKPKKNILVCPLDWGLGHASRCVPVIKELQRLNFNVIIGADKNPLAFLKQEFPTLTSVVIPGYNVTYDEQGSSFKLFCESIRFYNFIKKEHQFLKPIIEEHSIDLIISDNRYGLWNNKVKSIIITHQLFVKTPIGESLAHKKIHALIEKFDESWIPDNEGVSNLSGDLSHLKPFKHPHRFIGPLSRFSSSPLVTSSVFEEQKNVSRSQQDSMYKYDVLAILSGPEPQRTIFEKIVLEQMKLSKLKCALVSGNPTLTEKNTIENITTYSHLPTHELQELIEQSRLIVCRSGYSSIMDLTALGKQAILVPTPGQTEQEYLAQYHMAQGNFYMQKQNEFNLEKAILKVYNAVGSLVYTKNNRNMTAGNQKINFDGSVFPQGMYFVNLTAGNQTFTRKLSLQK